MKKRIVLPLLLSLFISSFAFAQGSFRLKNGNLLSVGKTKSDIVALVGAPLYKDVLIEAVDIANGDKLVKTEEFTYKLKGSIGGMYIVLIRFENNIVTSISSKQVARL
ncbi:MULTISPECIES: hypothetical protein [unclassified Pseudoalteromonas]|uniref:hypothetical protein n=1 Tax=unclassified Pseudoalteromonas TaxID=194690 RepID=UPI0025811EC9|nr:MULTISPECIES: hypothetical protein [unclassified Pseudoalteromonas]|tara:strand:+ start:397 stop:720 length:324 start_codon:yes stop_codon:yes gene_type:complete